MGKLNPDRLVAAVVAADWAQPPITDLIEGAEWLGRVMTSACNDAMPRIGQGPPTRRRSAYWWSETLSELRRVAGTARRRFQRTRRRAGREDTPNGPARDEVEEAYEALREARRAFGRGIAAAKARAWEELLLTVDGDPWGRPYKFVLSRFRTWAPPLTVSMAPQFLERVVGELFPHTPAAPGLEPPELNIDVPGWSEELGVTERELRNARRRMGAGKKAPGPDGIPGRAWAAAFEEVLPRLGQTFSACLRRGRFPPAWQRARLVMIRKAGRPEDDPSAYRPICLLDEAGKLLERVIASRLVRHLSREGPDLHPDQYGFREGRSTIDAIKRVRSLTDDWVEEGGVALAVTLDIANAFNTLPWDRVREAVRHFGLPPYMVEILQDYFRGRRFEYTDRDGTVRRREMCCGVPQGSVLGPLLWDLAYDRVLRSALPPGAGVVCYADDTLVIAGGTGWGEARAAAEIAVASVMRRIRALGLRVALRKCEAMYFYGPLRVAPPATHLELDGARIPIGAQLTYLGLRLDSRWTLRAHIQNVVPRAERVAAALSRLLPNVGGPQGRVRRLYANTVQAVVLYGAPIWAGPVGGDRVGVALLRRLQRKIASRVARCYCTVSHAAATALARLPPLELLAKERAVVYHRVAELRREGVTLTARAKKALRIHARQETLASWQALLEDPRLPGQPLVGAVQPRLAEWASQGYELTY